MSSSNKKNDILRELFNISVAKAASILSEIINKKIILTIPNISIIDSTNNKFNINKCLPKVLNCTLMVSSITFKEELAGRANLIFPAQKMRTFINLCLNEEDNFSMNFTDIDFDIIKEVGNIILNSIVGQMSNFLQVNLEYTIPEVNIFDEIDFEKNIETKEYMYIVMLYITFNIDGTEIDGAVIIDLTLKSLKELINKISKIEDEIYG